MPLTAGMAIRETQSASGRSLKLGSEAYGDSTGDRTGRHGAERFLGQIAAVVPLFTIGCSPRCPYQFFASEMLMAVLIAGADEHAS